ncbi:MAG TPA: SpoIIE family protein phosphatase [Actinomycetota bacterium]|nr:SpoIIE family protein phosphatase [Actinomycetota bacterium]
MEQDLFYETAREMRRTKRQVVTRGSWRWSVRVAEMVAWSMTLLVLIAVLLGTDDPAPRRAALGVTAALGLWLVVLFRVLLPRVGRHRWVLSVALVVDLGFAAALFAILRTEVPSMQLVFVPVIVAVALLGRLEEAVAAPALAFAAYWAIAASAGASPDPAVLVLTGGIFFMSGATAGLVADELRRHLRAEHEEHRLATAVRHRLMAVLDAVDEAIVFSDRVGVVRVVNRRAAELFDLEGNDYLGAPLVQLLRTLARKTEDPEGYMETFQHLRDDPGAELRVDLEQILPARRRLQLYSGPALDETGTLVGRIDVYTDLTEAVRRAEELERAFDTARKTAESYQRSLLPDAVPKVPRVSFVAHYVPAAGRRVVCGDFYDFVTFGDGRIGVALGDVVGVGPDAVGDAALARYTLESFATEESDPARLLRRLNDYFATRVAPERFVRLFLGVLDPERAVLEYASAGHVPPVVSRASRDVHWLEEGGIPLGVEDDADYKVGRVELRPGDMLVLYTDGVTEASRRGKPFGRGRFMDIIRDYGIGTPGELSQAIRRSVDSWVGGESMRDDLAILICQVAPDEALEEPTRELVLPNETARLRDIRGFVVSFLADARVPVEVATEIQLAAGEAAGNAARHGRKGDGWSEVRVRCRYAEGKVTVIVADDGPGFDPGAVGEGLPDKFASGGRGLFLMRQLMENVEIDATPDGTTVTMSRSVE